MSADFSLRYPRGGAAIWTGGSVASTVLNEGFFGVPAQPPTAPVVSAHTFTGYTSAGVTTTSPIAVAAGDRVLVYESWQTSNVPPVLSDSQSGSFTPLGAVGQSGFIVSGGCWYRASVREITAPSASYTVTATKADGYTSIFLVVVSGAVELSLVQLDDSTAPWSHQITTTDAALIVGYISPEGQANLSSIDATPTGFTELDEILSFDLWQGATAYRTVEAPGTYTWTPGVVGGSVATAGLVLVALYAEAQVNDAGYVTVWHNNAWVRKPLKVWTGATWVIKPLKRWNNSSWEPT